MAYAWRWTASVPWEDEKNAEGVLLATNAFIDSSEAQINGKRLEIF